MTTLELARKLDQCLAAQVAVIRERDALIFALERVLQLFEEAVILAGNDPDTHGACIQARAALEQVSRV